MDYYTILDFIFDTIVYLVIGIILVLAFIEILKLIRDKLK